MRRGRDVRFGLLLGALLRGALLLGALLGAGASGGCSALVQVDAYIFDEDPCGPRPRACTGGRQLAFVVVRSDVPRADAQGRRDGFDLDGTSDAICGQRDLLAPDGRAGIDNQLAGILELYENLSGQTLPDVSAADVLAGRGLQLVVLSHVDDLQEDDCVSVSRRPGFLPAGVDVTALDRDGDGALDEGLTFDFGGARGYAETACILDGVVHARFPSVLDDLPGTSIEGIIEQGRLRMPISEQGTEGALLGGSVRVADLTTALPPGVIDYLQARADLAPSSRTAADCSALSFGLLLDLAPVRLGTRAMSD